MSTTVKVPYYNLTLNGVQVDEYRLSMIQSITLEDNSTGSDLLRINLYDPDLKILEDNIFVEECPVTFIGGWYRGDVVKFEGFISVIDIDFPQDGTPQITINCMDKSHIMNRTKKKRTWENTKASSVASQIFREYGLSAVVHDTGSAEETISQNGTDIQFLIQLADDQYENFIVYVEGNKGYFIKKPNIDNPQATLQYREGNGELLSFSPRINKQVKQMKVDKSDVNTKDNAVDSSTTNDTVSRPTSGSTVNPSESNKPNSGGNWVYENGKWVQK